MSATSPPTLILGLGNPLLGDDGVGPAVARAVHARLPAGTADLLEASTDAMGVLDLIQGYRRLILVDALRDRDGAVADVREIDLRELGRYETPRSSHDIELARALELGRRHGVDLPAEIRIFGVVVHDADVLRDSLSPPVAAALDPIAAWIEERITA